MPRLPELIASIAEAEIGASEDGASNCSIKVNEYRSASNLDPGNCSAWCAVFICWCVRQALDRVGMCYAFERPETALAWGLQTWGEKQAGGPVTTVRSPDSDIRRGDILVYNIHHCGIAVSDAENGVFYAVEGNTNADGSREGTEVLKKSRKTAFVKARIRIDV